VSQAYPVFFALGCLAGLCWLALRRGVQTEASAAAFMAALFALALGLAGARLGFAALHWPYYSQHPQEILWLWQGGLSWVGGAVGVVAAVGAFARVRGLSFASLADAVALPALAVALAAWTGCFLDGCVYGLRTPAGPLFPQAPDLFGVVAPRWPTAALGVIAAGVLLSVMVALGSRPMPSGLRAALALGGVALIAFALSFTRGDPVLLIGGLRIDTVGAAAVLLIAAIFAATRARESWR